jgi:hypothetical protein
MFNIFNVLKTVIKKLCLTSALSTHMNFLNKINKTDLLTVKIRQPSHEFTFGVGMTFVSYPLVLTPVV